MKFTVEKELKNNTYYVVIRTENFDAVDEELFHDFNEPFIEVGGDIYSADATPLLLTTLPTAQRRIQSQFPVFMRFQDQEIAEAWIRTVELRMVTAMNELRMKLDDFTGTEEFVI